MLPGVGHFNLSLQADFIGTAIEFLTVREPA
jgi:hypothetical protein